MEVSIILSTSVEGVGLRFRCHIGYSWVHPLRLVSYLALADTIFAGEKMGPLFCRARDPKGMFTNTQKFPVQKKDRVAEETPVVRT